MLHPRRRRVILLAISLFPSFIFLVLIIRGVWKADVLTFTHSSPPQWQLELSSAAGTQVVAFRVPNLNKHWGSAPAFQHQSFKPAANWEDPDPSHKLFDFLGLNEFHFGLQPNEYHELHIPTWMTFLLILIPVPFAIRVGVKGTAREFLTRLAIVTLTLKSALCCLLLILLSIRSYHSGDILHCQLTSRCYSLTAVCGEMSLEIEPIPRDRPYVLWLHTPGWHPMAKIHDVVLHMDAPDKHEFRFIDFQYAHLHEAAWARYGATRTVAIPFWFPILLTGVLPAMVIRRAIRARLATWRAGQGRCRKCGQDLSASPTHCPRCGTLAGS